MKNSLSAAGNSNLATTNYRFAIAEHTLQFNENGALQRPNPVATFRTGVLKEPNGVSENRKSVLFLLKTENFSNNRKTSYY